MAQLNPAQLASDSLRQMEREYNATGIRMKFWHFIAALVAFSLLIAMVIAYVIALVPGGAEGSGQAISFLVFIAILSMILALPISMKNNRIQKIDESLPDALKHMGMVLKAGGTVESSIDEVSRADYGPLSDDLKKALEQMRKGKTFEQVLHEAAINSGSHLFERCAGIITDAKRAGAGIADVMQAIADDARDVTRIKRERISRTTMHVLFLYVASLFISPFIFGFTITITSFIGTGIACAVPDTPEANTGFLNNLLMFFLVVEAVSTTLAVGVISEGKALRHVVRIPAMVLLTLAVYEVGKRFGAWIIGGGGSCG